MKLPVELNISERGQGTVVVDGRDVAGLVRGVRLDSEVGEIPVVELELIVSSTARVLGHVAVDEATYDLLLRLGWTPPVWAALRRLRAREARR